jgi:hypothetical protein
VQKERPSQKTLRSPAFYARLCPGVLRIFLASPLSYAAVAFFCGHDEKLLRCGKLATSYMLFYTSSRYNTTMYPEKESALWHGFSSAIPARIKPRSITCPKPKRRKV